MRDDLTRQPIVTETNPQPESVRVLHKGMSADSTLIVVVEGFQHTLTINRRQLFSLARDCFEALRDMEPGR